MAKVTITLEDTDVDGEAGLRISMESDPRFEDSKGQETTAQNWALDIVELIVGHSTDVRYVDDEAAPIADPESGTKH